MYRHRDWKGVLLELPHPTKVVCVGSNYASHIKEMDQVIPKEPVLFIKPESALCDLGQPIVIPKEFGAVHHEVELAILIGTALTCASEDNVARAIAGYAVALDLTLRDLQAQCKKAGQPWEKAKSFDGSCPISGFIPIDSVDDLQSKSLQIKVDGEIRQCGNTRDMMTPILPLIAYMSRFFTLRAGDIVLTGTPEGVGPIVSGNMLEVSLDNKMVSTRVI